ncbi:hypothetical protein QYF36_017157 [Acer negundo]|nr:hypothetical protein QYF36_017157 [Acer negundo]
MQEAMNVYNGSATMPVVQAPSTRPTKSTAVVPQSVPSSGSPSVKGRRDFDGSDVAVNSDKPIVNEISTSESEIEADIFDMDLPNLDAFGVNFSFSKLLVDFDLDCEGLDYSCHQTFGASMDNVSGYFSLVILCIS